MTPPVRRVVLTGSECTGKTTLGGFLARQYGALFVHEYARKYAAERNRPLTVSDHWPLVRGHVLAESRALARAQAAQHRLLVLDTDILSTVTYAQHYTGQCDPAIEVLAGERLADHYLLLDIDVPWVADGMRDRGDRRPEMHALFLATLERFGAPYTLVSGSWDERMPAAMHTIDTVLARSPDHP
jgi:NadR type nicotinamide-nucleotide adenylyltransferase